MAWGLHDSVEIERTGKPAVTVVTQAFAGAAAARAAALGLSEHPTVVIEHPLASQPPAGVEKMARDAVRRVASALVGRGGD